jgi:hypothetical protein
MTYIIARLITLLALMIGTTWLIVRYRAVGVVVSLFLGWGILFAVYRGFPAPPDVWDEDGEEIPYTAPILMMIWCFPVWGVAGLLPWFKRQRKPTQSCPPADANGIQSKPGT